jgi:GT2 family glycosyltransferase
MDVVLVENGPGSASVCSAWESRGVEVHRSGRNLGVAASWNEACRWAWDRGHDTCVLLNDDVRLADAGSLALVRSAVDA